MSRTGRTGRLFLLVLAVLVLLEPGVSGATLVPQHGAPTDSTDTLLAADIAEANNSSVQHRDPRVVDDGDLRPVQAWLAGQLGDTLIECTRALETHRTARCERLDREYPDWASKYIEITRETASGTGGTAGRAFRRAGTRHAEFRTQVEAFRETHRAYQMARAKGNTSRSRELARRLVRLATQINQTGTALTKDYRVITTNSSANLTTSTKTVDDTTRNISLTAENATAGLFVDTKLTARARSERISFRSPLRIRARLTLANGTPVADRSVTFRVGRQRIQTTTDPAGRMAFQYRPTTLPLDTQRVRVQYVPTASSIYRGSSVSIPVSVTQIDPTITSTPTPTIVGFNDTVTVTGRVTADGVGAADVPVVVAIGEDRLERVTTDSTGAYAVRSRLPATVAPGNRTVRAAVPLQNRALGSRASTARIVVNPTPTRLTLALTRVRPQEIRVTGHLLTATGTPVRDQPVRLAINGDPTSTVTTTANGSYTLVLPVGRDQPDADQTVTVIAAYNATGTNLHPAHARETIRLQSQPPPGLGLTGLVPPPVDPELSAVINDVTGAVTILVTVYAGLDRWQQLALGIVGALFIGGSALVVGHRINRYRTARRRSSFEQAIRETFPADAGVGGPDKRGVDDEETERRLIIQAENCLERDDPDGAVMAAYWAARDQMTVRHALIGSRTPREFLAALTEEEALPDTRLRRFEELTDMYEQAAFSPIPSTVESASQAIEIARIFDTGPATESNNHTD